jgi:cytochrome bd-type quinol oxidase subunit 1
MGTRRPIYQILSNYWIRIFAVAFAMGVVTGIVMPFQFGTNCSRYADATANVLSPLFAYEGLTAFFLEAAFLGVLLFGRSLVPRWTYLVAALMVASGTLFSSFWILAANSWMQTPDGRIGGLAHQGSSPGRSGPADPPADGRFLSARQGQIRGELRGGRCTREGRLHGELASALGLGRSHRCDQRSGM